MQKKLWFGLALLGLVHSSQAQVVGGQRSMEFLRLPNAPHITALGGINVSSADRDISFAIQNPSLMRPGLHNNLGLNYNLYYSGIGNANLAYGYHVPKINTSFVGGIQYINYGNFIQTDNIGNEIGTFKANDFVLNIGASRQYKEHWRYGIMLKWANSSLNDKKASALLSDVGITYYDTSSLITVGVVAKNMGITVNKFNPDNPAEPLPFDLQLGISKRFKYVPLRLMATVHHLYQWDVRYNDPSTIDNNNIFGQEEPEKEKSYFADKLFRHFIFGAEIIVGKRILITASYNHLRRGELAIKDKTGLAGFSFGGSIKLNKFDIYYARSYYHIAGAYNEFGLNMSLNKLFGIGKLGDNINWSATYPDWEIAAPTSRVDDVSSEN